MSPSWPDGNEGDKLGRPLLGSAPVCSASACSASAGMAAARRVSMVGTSGAGKSTLARSLADALGADLLELDSVNHQADWVPLPTSEFRRQVASVAAGERWVIDGNYS